MRLTVPAVISVFLTSSSNRDQRLVAKKGVLVDTWVCELCLCVIEQRVSSSLWTLGLPVRCFMSSSVQWHDCAFGQIPLLIHDSC